MNTSIRTFFKRTQLACAALAAAAAVFVASPAHAQADLSSLSATDIVASLDTTLFKDVTSEVQLLRLITLDERGNAEKHLLLSLNKKDATSERWSNFMRVLSPQMVSGTTLLLKPAENTATAKQKRYLYLPSLGDVREIGGDGKGQLLNSVFSFEDLERETEARYNYTRLADDVVRDTDTFVLEATPKNKEAAASAYTRRLIYIAQNDRTILKVEFYNRDEKLAKTLEAYDYQSSKVDGETMRPLRAIMTDHLGKATSIITTLRSRVNQSIDDKFFNPEAIAGLTETELEALYAVLD
jgi:hypothetical protein